MFESWLINCFLFNGQIEKVCGWYAVQVDPGFGTGWVSVAVVDGVVEASLVAAVGSELVNCGAGVVLDMMDEADLLGGKRALAPTKNSLPKSIARIFISLGGQPQSRATSSFVVTTFLISVK